MNQRVRSPEPATTQQGTTAKPDTGAGSSAQLRVTPNPTLPAHVLMRTVGQTRTVLPLATGQTAPQGSLRASQFQQVDAMRAQALGSGGAAKRFDETAGAPYYAALTGARELDAARRDKSFDRVARSLEGRTAEEIGNIRLIWKSKMGPESLDVALRGAFPNDADRLARLLRGIPKRS